MNIKELIFQRELNAPKELVFKVWTDPNHLAKWWGPKGFENPLCKVKIEKGGQIQINMQAPNGQVFPMKGEFLEITPFSKIIFLSKAFEDEKGNFALEAENQIFLDELSENKTLLTVKAKVIKATEIAKEALSGMEEGWSQSIIKLEELVLNKNFSKEMSHSRYLNANIKTVFEAWSIEENLKKWWGPKGFSNTFKEFNFQAGGTWNFIMHGPDGKDYENNYRFIEIIKNEKIVMEHLINYFKITVYFEDLGDITKLKMVCEFLDEETYESLKNYAVDGQRETIEKLEESLKELK